MTPTATSTLSHAEASRRGSRTVNRLVMVTRKTRLRELVERFNSSRQAKFYIEHQGGDFEDYEKEDAVYRQSRDYLVRELDDPSLGYRFQIMDRHFAPSFLFADDDLIVTLGQDGLVSNTAKYVRGRPIIGVNPDVARHDGVLLPFRPADVRSQVCSFIEQGLRLARVTLASASLNDSQQLLAFNDLFIGSRTHGSARYRLHWKDKIERQSSSGILVSTGAGSSGWLSSVFNMASGIAAFRGVSAPSPLRLAWESRDLVFVVREPFASRQSESTLVADVIRQDETLVVESLMPNDGVIFSDGVEDDFIHFRAGPKVTIRAAAQCAYLVVKDKAR